ncbi:hypothetical protein FVR03_20220 [Pontibacter qinzhouensis]|uniref:Uncharacterized protein n=1 Tax=Pontibacter qinzhouensis TaxID=2603253 RepID=A0A5C8J4H3_9BACT|nr:hypothetical protein [Pontibacter qinzhouensis]TXK30869.1 hypothetical protein FVR03_20220 [Pontibacter qinzhouensis]
MRKNNIDEANDFQEDAMLLTPPAEYVFNSRHSGGHFIVNAEIVEHIGREHTYALILDERSYRPAISEYLSKNGDELPIAFDIIYYSYSHILEVYNMLSLRVTALFVPSDDAQSAHPNVDGLIMKFHDFINHATNGLI